MTSDVIKNKEIWCYSLLAIPIAFAGFPLYVLAPDYYATSYNISLTLMGLILLGLRLFDAFQDPLIGAFSDRYRSKSAWFMGISSLILCIAIYGLFNILPTHPLLWFTLCIATAITAYSILSINLNTLGGLWTSIPHEQTRISTLREVCGLIGLVIAVSLPSLLKDQVAPEKIYIYFCLILFLCMAVAWRAFYTWLKYNVHASNLSSTTSSPILAGFRSISRETKYFLGIYALSMLASAIPAVLVIFFIRDFLNAENMTGIFLLLYFLSGAAAMPLW